MLTQQRWVLVSLYSVFSQSPSEEASVKQFWVQVNVPLYVDHVSSEESGCIIEKVRSNGQIVYGEVVVSSMLMGDPHKATLVTGPPIRSNPENSAQLLRLLAS